MRTRVRPWFLTHVRPLRRCAQDSRETSQGAVLARRQACEVRSSEPTFRSHVRPQFTVFMDFLGPNHTRSQMYLESNRGHFHLQSVSFPLGPMASRLYVKTYQIVRFNYVQFVSYNLKAVTKNKEKKEPFPIPNTSTKGKMIKRVQLIECLPD